MGGERRFDIRLTREEPVNLCWEDQVGQTQQLAGLLLNISASGASVRAQRPVRVGTKLSLGYQNQELIGKVKHCAVRRPTYLLGIEFLAGHRWSSRRQPAAPPR